VGPADWEAAPFALFAPAVLPSSDFFDQKAMAHLPVLSRALGK
jgi:hypothetical protein